MGLILQMIQYEESSGNVFADLEIENPELVLLKCEFAYKLVNLLKDTNLSQQDIANKVQTQRYRISNLMNFKLRRISLEAMLNYSIRMGFKIDINLFKNSTT